MDFLTPGQKIRKLRKQFGLRQHDLQDEHMTRNFISMVEKNKRGLSADSASRLAEKFNKIAEENNIQLNIDAKYFLINIQEQAREHCIYLLESASNIVDIEEIITMGKKHSLKEELGKAYLLRGDIKYDKVNYSEAFIDYNESLNIFINLQNTDYQGYLYNRLGMCKLKEFDYVEGILYFTRAERFANLNNESELIIDTYYNSALCYKSLGKPEKSIEYLAKYPYNVEKEFDKYIDANILKAKCYKDKGEIKLAIKIYSELIEEIDNSTHKDYLSLIYNNLGEINLDKNEVYKALEYFEKAEDYNVDKYLPIININKARTYVELEMYKDALHSIEYSIKTAKKNNQIETLISGHYLLAKVYKLINDYIDYEKTYLKILKILRGMKDKDADILKINMELALLNLELGKNEKAKEYLKLKK